MLKWLSILVVVLFTASISFQSITKLMDWENDAVSQTISEEETESQNINLKAKLNASHWKESLPLHKFLQDTYSVFYPDCIAHYLSPALQKHSPPPDLLNKI